MQVILYDTVESAHQWIDEDGKRHSVVIRAEKGAELDSETLGCGDAERALSKLVKLGLAREVAE